MSDMGGMGGMQGGSGYGLMMQGIGSGISGVARVLGDRKRNKEYKKYQDFLRGVYNNYINDPGRKEAVDMVYKVLATGDYQGIFRNSLLEGLERNKANILAGERAMQDRSARGGFLRGGQQEDLMGRAREAGFKSDRQAYRDFASDQFGAKQWAAGQADNMAKGPFAAATQVAYPMNINPYTGYLENELMNLGEWGTQAFGGKGNGPLVSMGANQQKNPQQYMPQQQTQPQYSSYGPYATGYQMPQQQQSPYMANGYLTGGYGNNTYGSYGGGLY